MTPMAVVRADVWDASDKHCAYCKKALHPLRDFCIDHVMPKCAGGTDDMSNLVAACRPCNQHKGETTDRAMCAKLKPVAPKGRYVDGERMRQERMNRGLSMHQMSKLLGVSHVTVARAEAGKVLRDGTLWDIAHVLGVDWRCLAIRCDALRPAERARDG